MKAIIYARISTNKEKQNVKQQVDYCKKWAQRENYDVVRYYTDEQTGKESERKGYQNMLNCLREHPDYVLIVQDTDRLTRNFKDGVELESFIIDNGITLKSISENVDLNSPNGRFMFRIKLSMNCFYVENLVQKIRVGVARAKLEEGKYLGRKKGSKNKVQKKRKHLPKQPPKIHIFK